MILKSSNKSSSVIHRNSVLEQVALLCGLFSSLLYVITDLLASWWYEGYNIINQNYSELLATGAPTRSIMLLVSIAYNLLLAIFAVGIWTTGNLKRTRRLTAVAVLGYSIFSTITPLYFQMDMRGAEATSRGSLHGPMTALMSLFIILSMAFGAYLLGKRFRIYSFITIFILVVFGILTSLQVPRLVAGQATPYMGLTERINIYATMLWFAVFSIALYRKTRHVARKTILHHQ